jgi:hypothetical protein
MIEGTFLMIVIPSSTLMFYCQTSSLKSEWRNLRSSSHWKTVWKKPIKQQNSKRNFKANLANHSEF